MNIFNRFIGAAGYLALAVIAVVAFLVTVGWLDYWFLPWGISAEDAAEVNGTLAGDPNAWIESELRSLSLLEGKWKAIAIIVSLGTAVLTLPLLILELRGGIRKYESPLMISSTEAGVLNVEVSSIRDLVEQVGGTNRSVINLRCRIAVRRKTPGGPYRIIISCQPRVEMGSDLTEIRDDIQARVKETVERVTGLEVDRVNIVRVRYAKLPDNRLIE